MSGTRYGRELSGTTKGSGILFQQAAATDAVLLNFGRLVVGTASGLLCSPVGVYVAEVTTPTYRTSLGSIIRRAMALPYLQDERSNCMHALAIQGYSYDLLHGLGGLGFVMFHYPAWAEPGELPKSKSTQPM